MLSALSSYSYSHESKLKFLNEYIVPTNTYFDSVKFGGLSGIVWDGENDLYYSISDARNTKSEGQSRLYTLKIDISEQGIQGVNILNQVELVDKLGQSFKTQEVDGEGVALAPDKKSILWVSELGSPIRQSRFDGSMIADYSEKIPSYYNAGGDLKKSDFGLRSGFSFEGVSVTPSGKFLYVAAESALKQDGPISTVIGSSPTRILKYEVSDTGSVGNLIGEFIYNVDPIPKVSQFGVNDNGLSEILAVSDDKLLVIERSGRNASEGFKEFDFSIKVYVADLVSSTNIVGVDDLSKIEGKQTFQPAIKKLVIDFDDYTDAPDCIEGVTFGPQIGDKNTLIFVSDNNFQPYQSNKFFMFIDEIGVLN